MPLLDVATVSVRMAPPIACAIRQIPVPPAPEWSATPTVTVRGRRITVRPTSGYAYVQGVQVGWDGSLLVTRRTSDDMYSIHDFIRVGDRETIVAYGDHTAGVVAYRDARKDVATSYEEEGAAQVPLSPPRPPTSCAMGARRRWDSDGRSKSSGWTTGLLRGTTFAPLRFARPKGSKCSTRECLLFY